MIVCGEKMEMDFTISAHLKFVLLVYESENHSIIQVFSVLLLPGQLS